MSNYFLLLCLFFAHFLCDFTQLSQKFMLDAKRMGKPIIPIILHGFTHGIWTMFTLMFFVSVDNAAYACYFMAGTHSIIDILKGRINVWFPSVTDTSKYRHWWVFGLDQFAHAIVIITIYFYVTNQF